MNKPINYHASRESTIKDLEIFTLTRLIKQYEKKHSKITSVLEFGCGEGVNLRALLQWRPNAIYYGLDTDSDALTSAVINSSSKITFTKSSILDKLPFWTPGFDLVFTDRCIINIKQPDKQRKAIRNVWSLVKPGGCMILIENSSDNYKNQNNARQIVGLKPRKWPPFNRFIPDSLINGVMRGQKDVEYRDRHTFGSLHDMVLYVLIPSADKKHDGHSKWDYNNPLVKAAAKLCKQGFNTQIPMGQNVAWVFWKKESK